MLWIVMGICFRREKCVCRIQCEGYKEERVQQCTTAGVRKAGRENKRWEEGLPVVLSPLAACLWRLQRCRRPCQTWACCHWRPEPGCWQLLGDSAEHHLRPTSVNGQDRNTVCYEKKRPHGVLMDILIPEMLPPPLSHWTQPVWAVLHFTLVLYCDEIFCVTWR